MKQIIETCSDCGRCVFLPKLLINICQQGDDFFIISGPRAQAKKCRLVKEVKKQIEYRLDFYGFLGIERS